MLIIISNYIYNYRRAPKWLSVSLVGDIMRGRLEWKAGFFPIPDIVQHFLLESKSNVLCEMRGNFDLDT